MDEGAAEPPRPLDPHMKSLVIALITLTIATGVSANTCHEDSIRTISLDGTQVVMRSGDVYTIAETDASALVEWNLAENVRICQDPKNGITIENTDEDNKVHALNNY